MNPIVTPKLDLSPIEGGASFRIAWYLFLESITTLVNYLLVQVTAILAVAVNYVKGAPNLTNVGKLPKVSSAGTVSESAITDDGTNITIPAGVKVGIGINPPVATLDVQAATANIQALSTTGTNPAYQRFKNTGGSLLVGIESSAGGGIFTGSSAYAVVVGVDTAARLLQFATNNAVRVTIDAAGQVGFGNAAPGYPVDVTGDINASVKYRVAGVAGITGALALTLTTQSIQYKDWASVNQSITVVTNVTLTANAFTGGIRTT